MKIRSLHPCIVAALAIAGTLSAHDVNSRTTTALPHAELVFEKAATCYELLEEKTGDVVTVTWKAEHTCPNETLIQEYTVTVARSQATKTVYSLWSLGLQDAETGTVIEVASATGSLQIAESVWQPLRSLKTREIVSPSGLKALDPLNPASPNVVNDDHIWLMEFDGTGFTFKVKRYGRPGITTWSTKLAPDCDDANGHDNTPPI